MEPWRDDIGLRRISRTFSILIHSVSVLRPAPELLIGKVRSTGGRRIDPCLPFFLFISGGGSKGSFRSFGAKGRAKRFLTQRCQQGPARIALQLNEPTP